MARLRMASVPVAISCGVMSTAKPSVGSTPNSVVWPWASRMEQAEKRMPQPLGSSELNGMPLPPPVVLPITVTPGMSFIIDTKLLAALNVLRFVSTTTGLRQAMWPAPMGSI